MSSKSKDDVWIPTTCEMCDAHCGILVHRVDGKVVGIRGNPDDENTLGKVCAKSFASLLMLEDPSRVNVPLKRTNPEKGIGIDPGWVEITWDEALDSITERLGKIRKEDPRKLLCSWTLTAREATHVLPAFAKAFGTSNYHMGGSGPCGDAHRLTTLQRYACISPHPDPNYCNYLLNFGCGEGTVTYWDPMAMGHRIAEARIRGMRTVVIDPVFSAAAAKANEWIPIKPGTDAMFALATLNVLLNELNIFDAGHIKTHTNGPYLVNEEGYYIRDEETTKPMVWDPLDVQAKPYDDPSLKDYSIEGDYKVNEAIGVPVFSLLKEHVKKYSPEHASEITTVPPKTIRRVAREFGEAASIGSTIEIDGKTLPLRPVATIYFKGAAAHLNALANCTAIELLAEVVGARGVPGGVIGTARSLGFPETGLPAFTPSVGLDGFLKSEVSALSPWPLADAKKPEKINLQDLIPTAVDTSPLHSLTMQDPEKWKVPYNIEFNLCGGVNFLGGKNDPTIDAEGFKNTFQVSFELYLSETTYLSDIVLPDTCFLEATSFSIDRPGYSAAPVGHSWCYPVKQRVVKPMFKRRQIAEVILELAERLGILKEYYEAFNLRESYQLKPVKKYSLDEILDRRYKSLFGSQHGLEFFKKNGVIKWPKRVEEVYWKPFVGGRTFLYYEYLKRVASQVKDVIEKNDMPQLDYSYFQPLIDWKPCQSHIERRSEYDLFVVWRRDNLLSQRWTDQHPWIDEICEMDPYLYNIIINTETAKRKGLRDNDWVKLTSAHTGNSIEAKVRLSEGIHPEVICIPGGGGHWARGLPTANKPGKGALFEWLVPLDLEKSIDPVTLSMDWCVKAKIAKITKEKK